MINELVEVSTFNGNIMIMIQRDSSGYIVDMRNHYVIKGHIMRVANFELANKIVSKHLTIVNELSADDRQKELQEYLDGFPMNLVESLT